MKIAEIKDPVAVETETVETPRSTAGRSDPSMIVPITLFYVLMIFAVIRSPSLVSASGIGSAVIVATPLILATYALMASVISGRGTVDLSIGPLIGFINVTLVQLVTAGYFTNPFAFFGLAFLLGAAYQLIFALIVVYVRVQPIIVSLSGFLALSGINLVILPRPGGMAPEWMATWGLGTTVFSPVFWLLVIATLAWVLFTRTAFYTHLRLMGSDERAAYTSGVPIAIVRIGAHIISGLFAALAAITFTALISSGDPSQGTTYTLIAVTALVLGGASLAGGRASVFGCALGALNLYLITFVLATFNFGAVQSFVTDLAYGTILVISLLLTLVLPLIQRYARNFSPLLYFVALGVVVLGVVLHATHDYGAVSDAYVVPPFPGPLDVVGTMRGIFETGALDPQTEALRTAARPLIWGVVILVLLAGLARVAVTEGKTRDVGPLVFLVIGLIVLVTAYSISQSDGFSFGIGSDAPHEEGKP